MVWNFRYDIDEKNWTAVHPATAVKPPPMAGHSATVHFGSIVVFGGLHKQRSSIGQFQSSSDVWTFDIKSKVAFNGDLLSYSKNYNHFFAFYSASTWANENIPEPR